MSTRYWLTLTALFSAVLLVAFLFEDDRTTLPKLVNSHRNDWLLPPIPERREAIHLASLIGNSRSWGTPITLAAGSKTHQVEVPVIDWSIVGSFSDIKGRRHVIVRIKSGTPPPAMPTYLTVGDALPGGAKIVAIHDNGVCVLINNKKRLLPIYLASPFTH